MSRKSPDPSPSRRTAFRRSRALGLLISFVIIPALLVLALVLPPISLPERIFDADYRAISRSGTDLPSQDGARLSVPPEGMAKVAGVTKLKLDNIARTAFTEGKAGDEMAKALAAFPPNLDLKSPVYQFSLKGNAPSQAVFSAPILNNTDPLTTLDFYSWDGTRWEYLPGRFFDDDTGEASLTALPKAIAIAQTKPVPPVISAEMAAAVDLPKLAQDTLAELNPLGVTVKDDGSLTGQPLRVSSAQTTIVIPTISNLDTTSTSAGTPAVRADIVGKVLATDSARQAHVRAIADFAVQNLLPGVDIYYAGLKTDLRPYFTQFVRELAAELHARGKLLTVSVPPPVPISAGDWDTGAYDWQAIGQLADSLKIPAVIAPNAYQPNGLMDSLLRWTVARVNRYKVQVLLDTQPQDRVNNQSAPRTYEDTLRALVGKIKVEGLSRSYATPQQDVKLLVSVADGFNGFQRDDVTKAYSYTYKDETGRLHTVSLETPESVAFKMALVSRYNLRGVAFRGLLSAGADASLWSAIAQYRQAAAAKAGVSYEVVWTVTDSKGQPIQVE
ncbi:MAG: hypothetical protein HY259_04150, partial [Chloroflexi bacterium]|nr:hypothetical protein [Chloroflexota bacterium]